MAFTLKRWSQSSGFISAILDLRPVPLSDEHRASILQPDDVAEAALMIACLPARAHVVELVMKAT